MKVAIIPARGGSKRIPRKNVKLFAGKPMIAHSIAAAQTCGCFDRVIVSTDDREIAEIAREFGAETPFERPAELANEYAGTVEVIQHAVRWLKSTGASVEFACCLYATAPFVTAALLREGFDRLLEGGRSYAFTVAAFPSPIQRALRLRPDGAIEPMWPENAQVRSQDLEPAFHDAGMFYWGTAKAWEDGLTIHSDAAAPVIVPAHRVQDIDTPEDWIRAGFLFEALQREAGDAS